MIALVMSDTQAIDIVANGIQTTFFLKILVNRLPPFFGLWVDIRCYGSKNISPWGKSFS